MLKKLTGFSQFIKINSVDDESIHKAANNLQIVFVKKNDYLFHEGDDSNYFYGILSGKISMRKTISKSGTYQPPKTEAKKTKNVKQTNLKVKSIFNKKQNTKNSTKVQDNTTANSTSPIKEHKDPPPNNDTYEEELFTRGEGYCFGEWGLIYRCPRATSVYTLEDTYFFSLDEESFKNSFMKCLNKAESDRREFVNDNLFPFKTISYNVINELYKNTIPIQCSGNKLIYEEGATANTIYIVYMDQFSLYKKYYNESQMKTNVYKILSIEKGGVIGLEAIFEEDKKYKYTFRANCGGNIGMIFSINIDKIPKLVIYKMKRYFCEYYTTFAKTALSFFNKKIKLEKNSMNKIQFEVMSDNDKCQKAINNYFDSEKEIRQRSVSKNEIHRVIVIRPFSLTKHNFFSTCKDKIKRLLNPNASYIEDKYSTERKKKHKRGLSCKMESKKVKFSNNRFQYKLSTNNSTITKTMRNITIAKSASTSQIGFPKVKFTNDSIFHSTNETASKPSIKLVKKTTSIDKVGKTISLSSIRYNTGSFNIPLVSKII